MQTNEASLVGTTLRNKYYITEILNSEIQGGQGKVYFAKDITAAIEKDILLSNLLQTTMKLIY
ncbi:MAG: hypothetical protein HC930_09955 [Hydrococcus sp. SU_1_0]|nr:hypothetical protein [Hydrococcus sp. SU_1_0]